MVQPCTYTTSRKNNKDGIKHDEWGQLVSVTEIALLAVHLNLCQNRGGCHISPASLGREVRSDIPEWDGLALADRLPDKLTLYKNRELVGCNVLPSNLKCIQIPCLFLTRIPNHSNIFTYFYYLLIHLDTICLLWLHAWPIIDKRL